MSPAKQRAAIAEARGWTYHGSVNMKADAWLCWAPPGMEYNPMRSVMVPDYLNDRNAMAEALKTLTHAQHDDFATHLWAIVEPQEPGVSLISATWIGASAKAAEIGEAFLRTLNLWEESK